MAILERDLLDSEALRHDVLEPAREALLTDLLKTLAERLPWVTDLPAPDINLFLRELFAMVLASDYTPETAAEILREWRATAEVYADEGLVADLLDSSDDDEEPEPIR